MKFKKLTALLTGMTLVAALGVLAACGDSETSSSDSSGDSDSSTSATYQFAGTYSEGLEFLPELDLLLNLEEGGEADVDTYKPYSYDTSAAESNTGYTEDYMTGTWEETEKNGVACLKIVLEVNDEDETLGSKTYYAYESSGTYSFEITFPMVIGMSYTRTAVMYGSATKTYADADAFIQAYAITFEEPDYVAIFTDEDNDAVAYIQEDGTVLIYEANVSIASGTYTKDSDGMTVTISSTDYPVTVNDDGSASFTYVYSPGAGYETEYTFTTDDYSAIPETTESDGDDETAEGVYVGTYGDYEFTLTLDEDNGTAVLSTTYYGYTMGVNCYYTLEDSVVTLTRTEASLESQYEDMIWELATDTWTVSDDGTMTAAE